MASGRAPKDLEQGAGEKSALSDDIDTKEDALAGRAAALRHITGQVHAEADAHNTLLSSLESTLSSARAAVGSAHNHLPRSVQTASSRQLLVTSAGIAIAFTALYALFQRSPR